MRGPPRERYLGYPRHAWGRGAEENQTEGPAKSRKRQAHRRLAGDRGRPWPGYRYADWIREWLENGLNIFLKGDALQGYERQIVSRWCEYNEGLRRQGQNRRSKTI